MAWRAWRARREASWSQKRKWWDHKPSSVYSLVRADGHLSGMTVASHLVRPTRSSNDPGRVSLLIWPCSDRGLPCHACCQARGGLLPRRFTLTLWIQGRSVLCGPFRRLAAPRRYLAVCPVELGLSSGGPCSRPSATIGPTTSNGRKSTGRPGAWARLYFANRRITRATLSEAVPSSQKPACSPYTNGRRRAQSAVERPCSGANWKADSATIPRSL